METIVIIAEKEDEGLRADLFLAGAGETDEMSRSSLQKLIDKGCILLNGKPFKAKYKIQPGDVFAIHLPRPEPVEILPENIPLDIRYEDASLIVVNKPAGMVVHPAPGHSSGTLVNALLQHCGDSLSGINGEQRPGIVHRIDKDTSGLIVAAKNDMAHNSLSRQLAEHSMTREYLALVHNGFTEDSGRIEKPLGRCPSDRKKMAVVPGGRFAATHYRVVERLGKFTLLSCRLETGRTHQIRVHMASMGHPLVGDRVYGGKQAGAGEGQILHARLLGFVHPVTGQYREFHADPPDGFVKEVEKARKMAGL